MLYFLGYLSIGLLQRIYMHHVMHKLSFRKRIESLSFHSYAGWCAQNGKEMPFSDSEKDFTLRHLNQMADEMAEINHYLQKRDVVSTVMDAFIWPVLLLLELPFILMYWNCTTTVRIPKTTPKGE